MVNSNVDKIGKERKETEQDHNDTSGHVSSLTVLKVESFEEESLNKVIITETGNKFDWTDKGKASKNSDDTVIDIRTNETCSAPQNNGGRKFNFWPFNQSHHFTKHLWKQRQQMRQRQEKHGSRQKWYLQQGYPQKKQQVMFHHGHMEPQHIPHFGAGYDDDIPEPLNYNPKTRNSFVLIVMFMVFIMLVITSLFITFVIMTPDLKKFLNQIGMYILIPSMAGLLISNYSMMCSPCARSPPCSYFILIITTICMSFMAGLISSYYRTEIILYAAICTSAIVFVCVILACTSFDFTKWSLFIVVIGTALSVMAIIVVITMRTTTFYIKPLHLGILVVSVLIQSVVLVIELQMVLGGRIVELAADDYALAAFMLYTSVVDVFIKMMLVIELQLVLGGKFVMIEEDDYCLGAFMIYTSVVDLFIKMIQVFGFLETEF